MSTAEKISITLPAETNRMIKERVDAGDYGSTSELIREALRVWQQREILRREKLAEIRAKIQEAEDDPRPSLSLDEVRAEFRARAAARLKNVS